MSAESTIPAIFRCLGDPTRRRLFERICRGGELDVSELHKGADVSQPAVSQHLKALREAGLVVERKQGRRVYYSAQTAALTPLVDWVEVYTSFWRQRLGNLRDVLKEVDR